MVVDHLEGSGVDEDATRAMRYKADAMRSAFEEYCTASTARVTVLTDAYNRQMNGHVVRNYDGLAPTLAGFTTERTPTRGSSPGPPGCSSSEAWSSRTRSASARRPPW